MVSHDIVAHVPGQTGGRPNMRVGAGCLMRGGRPLPTKGDCRCGCKLVLAFRATQAQSMMRPSIQGGVRANDTH